MKLKSTTGARKPETTALTFKGLKNKLAKEQAERTAAKFVAWCKDVGLPEPVLEYKLHKADTTRWPFLFDFAWPKVRIALEMEGGIYTRGAHGSVTGILRDIRKYNRAASQGWLVLRCQPSNMFKRETLALIQETMAFRNVELPNY